MQSDKDDLTPGIFPKDMNWTVEEAIASLEKVHHFVNQECERAINWYYQKKRSKRTFGYLFRIFAILSLTASGIIPVLSEMCSTDSGPGFSPAWATIALALAAFFIALDRLGGYTSGWIRYIRTGQILGNLQAAFKIDWEKERILLQDANNNKKIMVQSIQKCQDFLLQVNNVVRAETDAWAEDFQKVLIELDKKIKDREQPIDK